MFVVDAPTLAALMSGVAEMRFIVTCITPTGTFTVQVVDDQVGVQSTNQAQVTRTAAFVVTRDVLNTGILNPLSDQVYIRCSVRGGTDIPLFFGRVSQREENEQGHVIITCVGQINDIITDDFPQPWNSSGAYAAVEMRSIIQDVDGTIGVTIDPSTQLIVPPTQTWSDSRGQALDSLATSISANYQDGRAGGVIIYPNPFGVPNPPQTGITLSDGVGGVIVQVTHATSRANIYNSITITSEPLSDANGNMGIPVRVTVVDDDPSSSTLYGGSFGKKNRNYSVQTSMGKPALTVLALQILRQSLALAETWTIVTPFFPILDPDDVFGAVFNRVTYTLVVESVQHNGDATTGTTITARKLQFLSVLDIAQ